MHTHVYTFTRDSARFAANTTLFQHISGIDPFYITVIYLYGYICMHTHIYIYLHIYTCISMFSGGNTWQIYVYVCIYMHICIYIYIRVYTCLLEHLYLHRSRYGYTRIYMSLPAVYSDTNVYICIYTYIHEHTCIYMSTRRNARFDSNVALIEKFVGVDPIHVTIATV